MPHALLAEIIDARLAGEARAHPRQKLRIVTLAPVHFLVTDTDPGLFHILVHLELVLRVQTNSHLRGRAAAILRVLGDSLREVRRYRFCLHNGLRVLNNGALDSIVTHWLYRLVLFGRSTSTHFKFQSTQILN